ncbi:hypothetical protein SAMN04488025_1239 [Planifilum fulgidum]|jgi:hypothetical protein|uniref:Uncharacterized protein n=1 Tax=Planifilum fulgidum TaxID=201973 RepID=A0A1I2QHV4_9BACL|nr:hypothetical protein SAMN04488025_1239 [Planifilum fulgidum]
MLYPLADTWIFCPKERYVVEYYHEGESFLGFYTGYMVFIDLR